MNTKEELPIYELDNLDRRKIANYIYIQSPDLTKALNSIQSCRDTFKLQPEPDCILIYGDRGTGKTSLINQYISQHASHRLENGGTKTPVFSCEVTAASTVSQFYTSVLRGLGDPLPEQGHTATKGERLYRLLKDLGTELIIIDEFHELLDGENQKVKVNVASAIKTLINQTKIPVILSGTSVASALLNSNSELRRRFKASVKLSRFSIFTEAERNTFRKFLAEYDKALPFKMRSDLAREGIYERIYAGSLGLPSGVGSIMREASKLAIEDGSENIQLKHFIPAYEATLSEQIELPGNPFSVNISELKGWAIMDPLKANDVIRHSNTNSQITRGR